MIENTLPRRNKILLPIATGLLGSGLLLSIYFVIVSWLESYQHALDLFWQDRFIVIPISIGFGVQIAIYTILKKQLFIPVTNIGPSRPLMGAGGTTSTIAMVACCAHHVTDVLPIIGLTAAASFLAKYRLAFMKFGLSTTVVGIVVMLFILFKERRNAIKNYVIAIEREEKK